MEGLKTGLHGTWRENPRFHPPPPKKKSSIEKWEFDNLRRGENEVNMTFKETALMMIHNWTRNVGIYIYICFCGMTWGMKSPNVHWKSSGFQPIPAMVPSHRVPAASGTAVPRCSGASRYHLVSAIGELVATNATRCKPGTSSRNRKKHVQVTLCMNTLSAASNKPS